MACNSSTTVYWGGVSFATASQLFTDINLTTVVAPGWYSFAGVYRNMASGILGPPTSCPSCLVACTSVKVITGGGSPGRYTVNIDLGSGTGATIIRFEAEAVPSRLTWTYDGVSASEYSSETWGYKQGILGQYSSSANGGSYVCVKDTPISNNLGSNNQIYSGLLYEYINGSFTPTLDNIGNTIPVSLGPYNPSGVGMVSGAPGYFTMVIPKPNAAPSTLKLEVDVTCPANSWNIDVNCARTLNSFSAGVISGACGVHSTTIYTASVATTTGVSSTIGVYDWAFEDMNGVTPLPAGIYPVLVGGVNNLMTVDSDGVVSNIATC